ncbi:hypothetical protein [Microbulbifer aestuariivivens]|uniref:hypothetical protein n=1 Tax=Microbulbifer aestuariivivens TaxID=1908308 RepID=UPI0031E6D75B
MKGKCSIIYVFLLMAGHNPRINNIIGACQRPWICFLLVVIAFRAFVPTGLMLTPAKSGNPQQQGMLTLCPGHSGSAELLTALGVSESKYPKEHSPSGGKFCSFSTGGFGDSIGFSPAATLAGILDLVSGSTSVDVFIIKRAFILLPSRAPPIDS